MKKINKVGEVLGRDKHNGLTLRDQDPEFLVKELCKIVGVRYEDLQVEKSRDLYKVSFIISGSLLVTLSFVGELIQVIGVICKLDPNSEYAEEVGLELLNTNLTLGVAMGPWLAYSSIILGGSLLLISTLRRDAASPLALKEIVEKTSFQQRSVAKSVADFINELYQNNKTRGQSARIDNSKKDRGSQFFFV